MKIIDLTPEHEKSYLMCMEDWSDEMKEAGDHKCHWLDQMRDKGLFVKLAITDDNVPYGMIQCVPIDYSPAIGRNLYFVDCIWVHGYKEGIGNHQKTGTGIALLKAAEKEAISRSADGLVAWGLSMPFWMKASWYKQQGYRKIERNGMAVLLWKKFNEEAQTPRWVKEVKRPKPKANKGKVTVVAFYNGRCQVPLIMLERAKRAASTFGDQVVFEVINTFDRKVFLEWGISDGIYVEGKNIASGAPKNYEDIEKYMRKQVQKL